jgi:uncharacterized membrane protein
MIPERTSLFGAKDEGNGEDPSNNMLLYVFFIVITTAGIAFLIFLVESWSARAVGAAVLAGSHYGWRIYRQFQKRQ